MRKVIIFNTEEKGDSITIVGHPRVTWYGTRDDHQARRERNSKDDVFTTKQIIEVIEKWLSENKAKTPSSPPPLIITKEYGTCVGP